MRKRVQGSGVGAGLKPARTVQGILYGLSLLACCLLAFCCIAEATATTTVTPALGLELPAAKTLNWWPPYKRNFQKIDTAFGALDATLDLALANPVGAAVPYDSVTGSFNIAIFHRAGHGLKNGDYVLADKCSAYDGSYYVTVYSDNVTFFLSSMYPGGLGTYVKYHGDCSGTVAKYAYNPHNAAAVIGGTYTLEEFADVADNVSTVAGNTSVLMYDGISQKFVAGGPLATFGDSKVSLTSELSTDNVSVNTDGLYTWYDGSTGTPSDNDTTDFLTTLNTIVYEGYASWRMPSSNELGLLVDYGKTGVKANATYFSDTANSVYWSRTEDPQSSGCTGCAYGLDFSTGKNMFAAKSTTHFVRGVYGVVDTDNFTLVGHSEYTLDNSTGLMWSYYPTAKGINSWERALWVAVDRNYHGDYYSNWRLPTVKEMVSITRYSSATAFNSSYFHYSTTVNGTVCTDFFTGTTDPDNASRAFAWSNSTGLISSKSKSTQACFTYVRTHKTGTAKVPDTGQTKCYNSSAEITCPDASRYVQYYGQDGNYTINPPVYKKLNQYGAVLPDNATRWYAIFDNVTRKTWEYKAGYILPSFMKTMPDYLNPRDFEDNGTAVTMPWIDDTSFAANRTWSADKITRLPQQYTHGSPDTDNLTTSLHHTLGTGATQAAAGVHTHVYNWVPVYTDNFTTGDFSIALPMSFSWYGIPWDVSANERLMIDVRLGATVSSPTPTNFLLLSFADATGTKLSKGMSANLYQNNTTPGAITFTNTTTIKLLLMSKNGFAGKYFISAPVGDAGAIHVYGRATQDQAGSANAWRLYRSAAYMPASGRVPIKLGLGFTANPHLVGQVTIYKWQEQ